MIIYQLQVFNFVIFLNMSTLQDKEEPSEPVAATIASQPESDIISEAKKEEVDTTEASTIKPTHSRSKDAADARLFIYLFF